jgi:hypothetical protein
MGWIIPGYGSTSNNPEIQWKMTGLFNNTLSSPISVSSIYPPNIVTIPTIVDANSHFQEGFVIHTSNAMVNNDVPVFTATQGNNICIVTLSQKTFKSSPVLQTTGSTAGFCSPLSGDNIGIQFGNSS